MDRYQIGSRLRHIRESKGITMIDAAYSLDISLEHYARIESGANGMSIKLLYKMMEYFGVDANSILGIDGK